MPPCPSATPARTKPYDRQPAVKSDDPFESVPDAGGEDEVDELDSDNNDRYNTENVKMEVESDDSGQGHKKPKGKTMPKGKGTAKGQTTPKATKAKTTPAKPNTKRQSVKREQSPGGGAGIDSKPKTQIPKGQAWSGEEDYLLFTALYKAPSAVDWNAVAETIPGRDAKSCSNRHYAWKKAGKLEAAIKGIGS